MLHYTETRAALQLRDLLPAPPRPQAAPGDGAFTSSDGKSTFDVLEGRSPSGETPVAKKTNKRTVRREYTKDDVKELRAHSKARTPVVKLVKITKRTERSLRQKATKLGIRLGHRR